MTDLKVKAESAAEVLDNLGDPYGNVIYELLDRIEQLDYLTDEQVLLINSQERRIEQLEAALRAIDRLDISSLGNPTRFLITNIIRRALENNDA